jgi:hypothetical protein
MVLKRSSKQREVVPRRRQAADNDGPTPTSNPTGQFRRNQTLSSYRTTPAEESTRQKAHHLTVQRRKLGGTFAIVFGAIIFLGLLLWQLMAQIQVTTSTKQLSTEFVAAPYQEAINEYLTLNPAQRLRFLLNQEALSTFVSGQHPEVEAVRITGTPGIAEADFAVTFRSPVAGWQINSRQYYVDTNGIVFEKNYYLSPGVQIVDESGVRPEQGATVAGSRLLGFLGRVVSGAGERGYTVTRAVLPQDTTREVDIYLEGISTRIKFSIDRGAGEQTEDMDRALKYLQGRGMNPQYVDVRIAGRAAYR